MKIKCDTCGVLKRKLKYFQTHNNSQHNGRATYTLVSEPGDMPGPPLEPTPKLADECKKLLDNKWNILLFQNALGSYSAVAFKDGEKIEDAMECENQLSDDFEPSQALYRLTEKVFGNIV